MITVNEKKEEIKNKSIEAYSNFKLNDVRQCIEIICKLIILKEYGEEEGNKIIDKKDNALVKGYNLENAINSIIFHENKSSRQLVKDQKIHHYMSLIQGHTNIGSHNDDNSKLSEDDKLIAFISLNKVLEWLFIEYLNKSIPDEIHVLMKNTYSNFEAKNVDKANISLEWNNLLLETNDFNKNLNKYFLVTNRVEKNDFIENLFNINWTYIADFDKNTISNGLYNYSESILKGERNINLLYSNNVLDYSKSTLYWDFTNGSVQNPETLTKNYRVWNQKYIISGLLKNHIEQLHKNIEQANTFIFVFWENDIEENYIIDFLSIIHSFFPHLTLVVCSSSSKILDLIHREIEEFENIKKVVYFNISMKSFSIMLSNYKKLKVSDELNVPSSVVGNDIVLKTIDNNEYIKYIDDIKVIPANINIEPLNCNNYYKGDNINFSYLDSDCLIKRSSYTDALVSISNLLEARINRVYYISSEIGSGSTSFGYKLLWDLREKYPSIHLLNYKKKNTMIFIQYIYTLTKTPILIFVDSNLNDENIKSLLSELDGQQIKFVIVKVNRFINYNDIKKNLRLHKNNSIELLETLKANESKSLFNKLIQLNPDRQNELTEVKNNSKPSLFKYLFSAFLDDYKNIDKYIKDKIDDLTEFQKERLQHLCLIQYYTGLNVSIYFLTKKNDKYSLFENDSPINTLIQFNSNLDIRVIHPIVAKKIMVQLTGLVNEDYIKQKIKDLSIEFINFINEEFTNDKNNKHILEIINQLFIKRKIRSYDTDNNNGNNHYTDLLEFVTTNDRESIFEKLVEIYPNNSHFLAHLGRFYSIDRKNIKEALKYIDKAIYFSEIEQEDEYHDSILYNIKGMIYFREMQHLREIGNYAFNEILELAKNAYKYFNLSLEYDTQTSNDYSYINATKTLMQVLREGKKSFGSIEKLLELYKNDEFVFNIIDDIETYILILREHYSGENDSSNLFMINKLDSQLYELFDNYSNAISMLYSYLDTNNYNNHSIQRNIVRLTIKNNEDNIDNIELKKVSKFIGFLEESLKMNFINNINESDLILYLKLIRHKQINYNIVQVSSMLDDLKNEYIEEKVKQYNKNFRLQLVFYSYIVKILQLINGNKDVISEINELKEELSSLSINSLNGKTLAREWLSTDDDSMRTLIHRYNKNLKWDDDNKFFKESSYKYLKKCSGYIKNIYGQNKGYINFNGIDVFFVPRAKFTTNDLNRNVNFYLSFAFDGTKAWNVEFV